MTVKAETRPLSEPLPGGGASGITVTVEPLLGAEIQTPQRFMESDGGRLALLRATGIGVPKSRWWWIPIPAFLIRHPIAGPILVDTAMHASVDAKPSANLGRTIAAFAKFRMPEGDIPTQLRARGNFHRVAREWMYDEQPVTELGRAEAAFWRAW